ncbi:MAG TPA: ATP-binding protein [Oscillospiraceae bacterium]|nr:ATP-binding protein [Oscillospiraceae bacterium]
MKIAILSGKGGTGKTTVATSLVASLPACQYIDCDVEEPNGYIFLNPEVTNTIAVNVRVPKVDQDKCSGCGSCAEACQFNALAVVKDKVLVFPEICHHCGACLLACPEGAISEIDREIGVVEANADNTFLQGRLNIGEPLSIPVIQQLKKHLHGELPIILDCPPGASCAVVQSIEDCDYCILVAEPTPFGLHDLQIAVRLVKLMQIPCGVVSNKATPGNNTIQDFCAEHELELLMEIPFSREIAAAYSRGILPVTTCPEWQEKFCALYQKVEKGAQK